MAQCTGCYKKLPIWSFQKLCRDCRRERAQDRVRVLYFEERSPWSSPTSLLLGANLAVFVGMLLAGTNPLGPSGGEIIAWGGDYGPLSLTREPWRLITAAFVHIGVIHLLFNMWALWNIGKVAEHLFGRLAVIPIYLLTGASGSLLGLWWSPARVSAGASGAIFGLVGALIAGMYFCRFPVPKDELKDSMKSLVTFAGYSLLIGFAPGINNMAHLGGLLGGLLIGLVLGRVLVTPRGSPLQAIRPMDPEEYQRRRMVYGMAQPVVFVAMAGVLTLGYLELQRSAGPELRWHLAMEALGDQDWERAIVELRYIEEQDAENPHVHQMLASAYSARGDWEQATRTYERGIKRFPDHRAMAVSLAWAYLQQKQPQKALAWIEEFSGRAGDDPMTITWRAHALDALDRHAEALQVYEKGRARFPEAAGLLVQQALSHLNHGEKEAALPLAERAAASEPNDAEYMGVLAQAYEANGRKNEAEAAREKAEELQREREQ
jgi:membrane associated rhomboid family serine protease/Tfp pilus assembly protein PilF